MSASESIAFVAASTTSTFIVSDASATTLYNAPPTMAELMKEAFANMPDTLDTKKEIEEYFKNTMKDIVKAKKDAEPKPEPKKRKTKKDADTDETDEDVEKPKQPKKRKTKKTKDSDTDEKDEDVEDVEKPKQPKKRKTKKTKDTDTDEKDEAVEADEVEKPKRPLTKYQEFFKENYPKIDKAIPNKERCSKIAELWKIHKAELAEKAMGES
jgi:hypothetical protein